MSTSHPRHENGRIDELDGLRGLLALWVALSHIFCWCGFADLPAFMPNRVKLLWVQFSYASGAVDTFIILSGFVISYLLHARPQNYRQFMTGRFFRIYPVYLTCLLLGLMVIFQEAFVLTHAAWHDNEYFQLGVNPVSNSQLAHPFSHLFAHLTLLFGMFPDQMLPGCSFALLAPAWSITLEWQYYLVAPLLCRMVGTRLGLLVLGLINCGGFVYLHFWGNAFLLIKLPLFLIGIGSFYFYRWASLRKDLPHFSFALIAVLVAVTTIAWHWLALEIWILVFGCLFVSPKDSGDRWTRCLLVLRRMLLCPPLQAMGKISYPLYLVHWPVILFLLAGLLHWQPEITQWKTLIVMLCLGLPVILSAAWLLHKLVEVPLMRWGKKFVR